MLKYVEKKKNVVLGPTAAMAMLTIDPLRPEDILTLCTMRLSRFGHFAADGSFLQWKKCEAALRTFVAVYLI